MSTEQAALLLEELGAIQTDIRYLIFGVVLLCGIILGCCFWQGD